MSTPSDFDRLRTVLLDREQQAIGALQADVAALQQRDAQLASRLPEALQLAHGDGSGALQGALAPVVAEALDTAIHADSSRIVDALFPIIGPTIRKSIAEALRAFVTDLNRALEHSFTPRGLGWRIESWRTGVPFAQVVMKHTMRYRIDHLFLMSRESGLLLYRQSAPDLPDLDADAVAGMLTAIGDFVRDSVGAESHQDTGLASATVGEHLVQVHEGPQAVLACFIRGAPPDELSDRLKSIVEQLHEQRQLSDAPDAFDWSNAAAPRVQPLFELRDIAPANASRSRAPVYALATALVLALAFIAWQGWQHRRDSARIAQAIAATPGWELLSIARDDGFVVRALRDPSALDESGLRQRIGLPAEALRFQLKPYLSLAPELVAARARNLTAAPETVTFDYRDDGSLVVGGRATVVWQRALRERIAMLAGVVRVDDHALALDPDPAKVAALDAKIATLQTSAIALKPGLIRIDAADPEVAGFVALVHEIDALAHEVKRPLRFHVKGWHDASGSDTTNRALARDRAAELRQLLIASGMSAESLSIDDSLPAQAERPSVDVRVEQESRDGR